MTIIIGTRPTDGKIYELSGNPLQWSEFSVQPSDGVTTGIWGGPKNTIWTHNGKSTIGIPKYLFFNGSVWSEYTSPTIPSGNPPRAFHGSDNGDIVYSGGSNYIHKWDGVSWSVSTTGFSVNTIWCNNTGRYVWASTGGNAIYYSDDYGATWNDIWSQILSDLNTTWRTPWWDIPFGDINTHSYYTGAIWGLSSNEVYCSISLKYTPFLTYTFASVIKYDGIYWNEVSQRVGYQLFIRNYGGIGDGPSARLGGTPGMWSDGTNHYMGALDAGLSFEGWRTIPHPTYESTTELLVSGLRTPLGRNIIGITEDNPHTIIVTDSSILSHVFISYDNFDSFEDMSLPWSSTSGLQSVTLYGWMGAGIDFINKDPYPYEIQIPVNQDTIEFDVISYDSYVEGSSIDVYVDGVLAVFDETFIAPFNGIDSYFGHITTIEGYDGYKVILDYINIPWNSYQTIIIDAYAEDELSIGSDTWQFRIKDIEGPVFGDYYPSAEKSYPGPNTLIWAEVYDKGSGVDVNSIDAYIGGQHIYNGAFISEYDGPHSDLIPIVVDGYDGYKLIIDKVGTFKSGENISVRITALDREGN